MADTETVSPTVVEVAKPEEKPDVKAEDVVPVPEKPVDSSIPASDDSEYETLEEDNVESSEREEEEVGREEEEECTDGRVGGDESETEEGLSEEEGSAASDASVISGEKRKPRRSGEEGEEDDDEVGEREEGDGQESSKEKKLDHDEDRRDPQYIPKKGIFYEHDDRTNDTGEEGEKVEETPLKKGRVWKEPADKWEHDMFIDKEQSPKTAQELIDLYGYDIRNEEGPPKARRRRRYGRGPTKYTRNWEDENAYAKKRGGGVRGRGRGFQERKGDFPELGETWGRGGARGRTRSSSGENPASTERGHRGPPPTSTSPTVPGGQDARQQPPHQNRKVVSPSPKDDARHHHHQDRAPQRSGVLERNWMRGRGRGGVQGPPTRGRGRGRGDVPGKPVTLPFKTKGETDEEDIAALSKQFSNAVINISRDTSAVPIRGSSAPPSDKPVTGATQAPVVEKVVESDGGTEKPSVGGGGGGGMREAEGGRSKRYSTQRQRSLPQSTVQQPPQQAFLQTPPPPPPQHFYQQQHHGGYGTPAGVFPPEPETLPPPPMVAFLPAGAPAPAQFPPPPPPPAIINYVQPHQYHPIPIPPPQVPAGPPEVYTGQGGITYYSTQNQVSRPNTSRRVKLAIPIVPPPPENPQQPASDSLAA